MTKQQIILVNYAEKVATAKLFLAIGEQLFLGERYKTLLNTYNDIQQLQKLFEFEATKEASDILLLQRICHLIENRLGEYLRIDPIEVADSIILTETLELVKVIANVPVPIPEGQIYYGTSESIPNTEELVRLLPFNKEDDETQIDMITGAFRFTSVAIPGLTRTIGYAYDNTSEEDVTSAYLFDVQVVLLGTVPYSVFTLVTAIPYSSIHEQDIVLVTGSYTNPNTQP